MSCHNSKQEQAPSIGAYARIPSSDIPIVNTDMPLLMAIALMKHWHPVEQSQRPGNWPAARSQWPDLSAGNRRRQ
jgi:hypothetical protein